MRNLGKLLKRPFENLSSLATGSAFYLLITILAYAWVFFLLINLVKSANIPLEEILSGADLSQYIAPEEMLNILVNNIGFIMGSFVLYILIAILLGSFMTGYIIRCISSAYKGKLKMPKWNEWSNLFKNGILVSIMGLIYFLILLVFLLFLLIPKVGVIIYIILLALYIYISPLIIANFAIKGKFSAAFNIGLIFKKAFTGKYLGNILLILLITFAISIVISLISEILTFTVILPVLISAVLSFYTAVFFYSALGVLYSEIK